MFCPKCGAKAVDGALFCQKCGAKLPAAEPESVIEPELVVEPESVIVQETMVEPEPAIVQEPVKEPTPVHKPEMEVETEPVQGPYENIYTTLEKNIAMCPAIKSAKQTKKGTRLYGKTRRYIIKSDTASPKQVRIKSVLAFPFSIVYWMLLGVLTFTLAVILWELIKYPDGIELEYHHYLLFALCCIIAGAVMLIHSFVGRKEKIAVADYVGEIAKQKQISLLEGKRPIIFKVRTAAAAALVVIGILVLIFNSPQSLKYPNELLFDGAPIERFLDMTKEDVDAEFGAGEIAYQESVTGDDVYHYPGDSGVVRVVYSQKTGKVIYICFSASRCSYNGTKLDKTWDRVDDILQEQKGSGGKVYSPDLYTSEAYGSVHTGFYYYDGVYFGDIFGAEEYLAQQEFANDNSKFCDVRVYEKGAEDEHGLSPVELKDYKISLMYYQFPDGLFAVDVSLYSDEWVEEMNATLEATSDTIREDYTIGANKSEQLTKTYSNKEEGVSFMYPSDWILEDVSEVDHDAIASVANTDLYGLYARLTVYKFEDDGSFSAMRNSDWEHLYDDEADVSVTNLTDFFVDGHPAKKLTLKSSANIIGAEYFFVAGSYMYDVICVSEEDNFDSYEPIFDAIMDSVSITAAASTSGTGTNSPSGKIDELCFRGIPVTQLLGASYDDMIRLLGEPDESLYGGEENYYSDTTIYFDIWGWEYPYICGIDSYSLENFTYNGHAISGDANEMTKIIGREPDDSGVLYDTYTAYSLSYRWDYLGSSARFNVGVMIDEAYNFSSEASIWFWRT